MNDIEKDRTANFIKAYEEAKAQSFIIESINKDFFFEFADCLIERIQELEEQVKNEIKGRDILAKLNEESIPKQKVKDKIEELENAKRETTRENWYYIYSIQLKILEELLEESK